MAATREENLVPRVNFKLPGLKANKQPSMRLLRKPRAPAPVRPPDPSPPSKSYVSPLSPCSYLDTDRMSPPPSVHPSVVSPPPPSEFHSNYDVVSLKSHKTASVIRKGDLKYMLDPIVRTKTQLGTYVEGHTLVRPYKPRGPDALPIRPAKRQPLIIHAELYEDELDDRFYQPPEFTFHDFMIRLSEVHRVPLARIRHTMCSKHNYKKIQDLLAREVQPKQYKVNKMQLNPPEEMPVVINRIPHKQLLLEMAALVKEQVAEMMDSDMRSVIRSLPKYTPDLYRAGAGAPHTEILLYEDDFENRKQRYEQLKQSSELPGKDNIFHSSTAKYFQGSRRSNSPFAPPDEEYINPAELAVLDALMNGGNALSLKANFISQMPDIEPISKSITYLNISFNDFRVVPYEIFSIEQLTVLKMRNNPIKEIPAEIGRLSKLRVLSFSFCMVWSLPLSLFSLENLEHLDMSYNRLVYLPSEIKHLKMLHGLNVEGNQLQAMPMGALRLRNLKYLRVKNNFMHPLFWKESSKNSPQRLLDLTSLFFHRTNLAEKYSDLPEQVELIVNSYLACECCGGPMFGSGLRVIRPVSQIFGIKNLPFMFRCCSLPCKQEFMTSTDTLRRMLYGEEEQEQ